VTVSASSAGRRKSWTPSSVIALKNRSSCSTTSKVGASSDVMALSIATGLVKAIMVMVGTPIAAKFLGLKTPRSAMVFGGLAGTVSGVSAGLAATDRKLVPYGALVATFHTGLGCLLGPSLLFFAVKALVG